MEEVVAWKNGEFLFQKRRYQYADAAGSRWYDIAISYPEGKPK